MLGPTFNPDCICVHLAPGEVTRRLTILTSPADAGLRPTIRSGGGVVRVHETVVWLVYSRPYTEEEIRELPPTLREKARRGEILYEGRDVSSSSQGESSITVHDGQVVELTLEFAAPPEATEGITSATLVVESSAWDTTEVPVFCVVGPASAVPEVVPDKIRAALAPGEASNPGVTIHAAPAAGLVVAPLINGGGVIGVDYLVASKNVRRDLTPEEIEQLPPWPPSLREDLIRAGAVEQVETGRSGGRQPLAVTAGQMVQVYLRCTAPRTGFPNITEATLVIDSPGWRQTEISVRLTIGRIQVELVSGPVSISQSGSAGIIANVRLWAGPGDDVHFSLEDVDGKISLVPAQLRIVPDPRQRPGVHPLESAQLTLLAADDTPVGSRPLTLVARVFEQLQVHRVPFQLNVTPGGVSVGTRPWSITAKQGDSVTFEVFANSEGPAKNMTFTPGTLPEGVRMDSASFVVGPGRASQIRPVRLSIDRYAPTTYMAWNPISWSANNGIHSGNLNLPLTIELTPEERVFRQEITTPAGTALGGFAEVVIRNDGTYTFRGHMRGSGFDPYSFRIGFYLSTSIVTLADTFTSRVGGSLGGGPRDRDWDHPGRNELIREHWPIIRNATCTFNKWYENTGVLGTLEEFALTIGEFLVLRALAGPAAAAVLLLGPELAQVADLPVTRPHRIPGSIILSGVVILFGPLAAVPAVVAGIAVAAAEDVQSRPMHPSEVQEAKKVFGETLPIDQIRVTNLMRYGVLGPANFCDFNPIDETIILGMGDDYNTEITSSASFMHELTHAWQWAHDAFSPAKMWGAIKRNFLSAEEVSRLYDMCFNGCPWRDMHSEGQAEVVEYWYGKYRVNLDSDDARNDPFFRYIANNIRMGNP